MINTFRAFNEHLLTTVSYKNKMYTYNWYNEWIDFQRLKECKKLIKKPI